MRILLQRFLAASLLVVALPALPAMAVRSDDTPTGCAPASTAVTSRRGSMSTVTGTGIPRGLAIKGDLSAQGDRGAGQDGNRIRIVSRRFEVDLLGSRVSLSRERPSWDGRPGREIVVADEMGAHIQFYRALTWRGDGLRLLEAPGRGHSWMIDAAIWTDVGWKRRVDAPAGLIRQRLALPRRRHPEPFRRNHPDLPVDAVRLGPRLLPEDQPAERSTGGALGRVPRPRARPLVNCRDTQRA